MRGKKEKEEEDISIILDCQSENALPALKNILKDKERVTVY